MYCVYQITGTKGSYIGLTKNLRQRTRNHKSTKTVGDIIDISILAENLSKNEAENLETKFVKQFKTYETGCNKTPDGKGPLWWQDPNQANPMLGKKWNEADKLIHSINHPKDMLNKKHRRDSIGRIRAAQKLIVKEKVKCPHCSKKGAKPVMHRHHFENCKRKELVL